MLSHRVIFHGRRVCHARKPACGACTLAPSARPTAPGPTDPAAAAKLLKGPRAPSSPPPWASTRPSCRRRPWPRTCRELARRRGRGALAARCSRAVPATAPERPGPPAAGRARGGGAGRSPTARALDRAAAGGTDRRRAPPARGQALPTVTLACFTGGDAGPRRPRCAARPSSTSGPPGARRAGRSCPVPALADARRRPVHVVGVVTMDDRDARRSGLADGPRRRASRSLFDPTGRLLRRARRRAACR